MDAPASPEPAVTATTFWKRIGLGRLLSRIKMSWKRSFGDRNTRFEYQVTVPAGVDSASVSDRRTTTPESVEDPFERVSQKVAEQDSFPSWAAEDPEEPPVKTIVRSRAQMERLRKVTERYNLPIPNEYATFYGPEKEPHRVHRPTRMRIHRTCHRCNAMFRGARICPQCQHQACALCQATPQPRYLSSWDPIVDDPLAVDLEVDDYHGMQQQVVVTRAANRANPQLLVRKELRQRYAQTASISAVQNVLGFHRRGGSTQMAIPATNPPPRPRPPSDTPAIYAAKATLPSRTPIALRARP
ncbi:hypothetical protein OIDMADRAFT_54820 [Oidiodendron maius Zn]|uniref:Uncharacterized protein n=1 Tax=Oidiodendron maius (strain Zn) TaxID=913774 RepID=A0A0C3GVW7_OIDMZ|nr:hypothetical protein OIDMADRAFT_54820 [Oidiodendron maius Zn]